MQQNKLTKGPLLDKQGHLSAPGYAFELIKEYDRKAITAQGSRIKEWDYYLIYNSDFGIALTVADNSYMGLLSATFLDFLRCTAHTVSPMVLFPFGKLNLPSTSRIGDVEVKNKKASFQFLHEKGGRRLKVHMDDFSDQKPLVVDLFLDSEPRDSMVIATPFPGKPKAFYYNQKIVGLKAQGIVTYKAENFVFNKETSLGILDWGRGVWTYDNTWYWSAATGVIDGVLFGFNLGYGFGDTEAATENMLFYNGIGHKLQGIRFKIPKAADGSDCYMKPWEITSSDGRFEAYFRPCLDREALTSLGIIMSDQHQVFGYFTGKAILDDGTVIELKEFLGFAEKVRNKW